MTFTPMETALAGALSGMVKAHIRRGTRLIDLFVANGDPVMAQRLAEAVGREYIRNAIERRASFSNDTLRYLVEEEERLKANLQKSEAAVAEYKEKKSGRTSAWWRYGCHRQPGRVWRRSGRTARGYCRRQITGSQH